MVSSADEKKTDISEGYREDTLLEEDRYEVIDGEQLLMPTPIPEHQNITSELLYRMIKFIKENDLGKVYSAHLNSPLSAHLNFSLFYSSYN